MARPLRYFIVPTLLLSLVCIALIFGLTEYHEKYFVFSSSFPFVSAPPETPCGGRPRPYKGRLPSVAAVNIRDAVLDTVLDNLQSPWAMEFLSESTLLITESPGTMKIFSLDDRTLVDVDGLPDIPSGPRQIGLMDIALHPNFVENGLVYFSHATRDPVAEGLFATAVSRAELRGNTLNDVKQIFVATPYGKSSGNFGGALAFDRAGFLYIATGDRSEKDHSQNLKSLLGKIIRLDDHGGAPSENPFFGNSNIDDRIFAYGVRNPQGLVYDYSAGVLYETEHGPMGGDEVNIIRRGVNYGWPKITYGAQYNNLKIGAGTTADGLEQPLYYYLPSLAISPIEIYHGSMFRDWEGDLMIGALKGAVISKLDLLEKSVISEHRILAEMEDRVRDIKVAADGSIYILVENKGRLYRLHRKGEDCPRENGGEIIYQMVCASCHSAGLAHIPQIENPGEWDKRLLQGKEVLYRHSIEGFRGMPAKGLCDSCPDSQIKSAVDYMLEELGGGGEN